MTLYSRMKKKYEWLQNSLSLRVYSRSVRRHIFSSINLRTSHWVTALHMRTSSVWECQRFLPLNTCRCLCFVCKFPSDFRRRLIIVSSLLEEGEKMKGDKKHSIMAKDIRLCWCFMVTISIKFSIPEKKWSNGADISLQP